LALPKKSINCNALAWQPQGQEGWHAPALLFLLREKKNQSGGMGGVPSGAAPLGCYATLPDLRDMAAAQFLNGPKSSNDFLCKAALIHTADLARCHNEATTDNRFNGFHFRGQALIQSRQTVQNGWKTR
jgi:hypothetical protein